MIWTLTVVPLLAACTQTQLSAVQVPCTTALGRKVLAGAKKQLVNPAIYDASYQKLSYPMGDVDPGRGACTDVVIRALRHAGMDLQELIQRDRKLAKYPRISVPDKNIDHRRVPNLVVYFTRHHNKLPLTGKWEAGDIVCWKRPGGLGHIGVVSDRMGQSGSPLVIHNIAQTAEEDRMKEWQIVHHFRLKDAKRKPARSAD